VLIGERPGLSVASSVGAYLTYDPRIGRRDSERNCVSNVHADGLSYAEAAELICWLMTQAKHRRLTRGRFEGRPAATAGLIRTGRPSPIVPATASVRTGILNAGVAPTAGPTGFR
jgi:ethanolamine ammonia-lyase small subunit